MPSFSIKNDNLMIEQTTNKNSLKNNKNMKLNNNNFDNLLNDEDDNIRSNNKNVTDCVPVPSSEHVAEIVGRQGCKIKALRSKTNTYIKTPMRGEPPMFVITGRKVDVDMAKTEILSAAEHFSQIRAKRNNGGGGGGGVTNNNSQSPFTPTPSTSPS